MLVLVVALSACGPGLGTYDKPGLTYEGWKRDDTECRRRADGAEGLDRDGYARCMRERGYAVRPR